MKENKLIDKKSNEITKGIDSTLISDVIDEIIFNL